MDLFDKQEIDNILCENAEDCKIIFSIYDIRKITIKVKLILELEEHYKKSYKLVNNNNNKSIQLWLPSFLSSKVDWKKDGNANIIFNMNSDRVLKLRPNTDMPNTDIFIFIEKNNKPDLICKGNIETLCKKYNVNIKNNSNNKDNRKKLESEASKVISEFKKELNNYQYYKSINAFKLKLNTDSHDNIDDEDICVIGYWNCTDTLKDYDNEYEKFYKDLYNIESKLVNKFKNLDIRMSEFETSHSDYITVRLKNNKVNENVNLIENIMSRL